MRNIIRWEPLQLPHGARWHLESLRFEEEWLEIVVCSDASRVELRWDTQVLVLVRDEGDLVGVLSDPGFDFPHPFYKIQGSPLVRLFVEDSAGVRQATEVAHFALYTVDECVDVLATGGPLSVLFRS